MQDLPREYTSMPRLLQLLVYLLVFLAGAAALYVIYTVLHRFGQVLFLFGVGAILAYVLTPVVNGFRLVFIKRWLAILMVYVFLIMFIALLAILLVTPFIQQSQGLVTNLQNPSPSSLETIAKFQTAAEAIWVDLSGDQTTISVGQSPPAGQLSGDARKIQQLQQQMEQIKRGIKPAGSTTPKKHNGAPEPQTQVPPRYIAASLNDVVKLNADYSQAIATSPVTPNLINQATRDASQTKKDLKGLRHLVSTTPVLILNAQTWLDQHGIDFDLQGNLGKAAQDLNKAATSILNNAVAILSKAATVLLDTVLVLIISIYFVADGPRLIRWMVRSTPRRYREQAQFFVQSTDTVLGRYLRGQLVLALLAGLLGGGGAFVLGVPYAVLIGIMTCVLELIPIIGPLIVPFPPVIISAIFMPLTTTVILLVYYIVFQQIVTNVIGPRVMGSAVGIHPLEAMAAALIGYPLAGFLGSFLAIPLVGILHIIVREAAHHFRTDTEPIHLADEVTTPRVPPASAAR